MSPFFSNYGLLTLLPLTKSLARVSFGSYFRYSSTLGRKCWDFCLNVWEFAFDFVLCCFVEMAKRKERNELATQLSRCDVRI